MSMANSLEVRCPLLDHRLADLAAAVPARWNLHNGRGKQVFLRAVGDRLSAGLLSAPKKGFGVPLTIWFRGQLRDHLLSDRLLSRGFVSRAHLDRMIREHDSGRRDHSHWLRSLPMLELWFRS